MFYKGLSNFIVIGVVDQLMDKSFQLESKIQGNSGSKPEGSGKSSHFRGWNLQKFLNYI